VPSSLTNSGSTGPKLRSITQPEDHAHEQQEVLKREDAAKGNASTGGFRLCPVRRRLVVDELYEHEGNEVKRRRDEEAAPQTDHLRDHAADDGPQSRAEALRGLNESDRVPHLVPRRRVRRHRQRQGAVAREQSLDGAQREDVPRLSDKAQRRHDDDEADERPLDHHLAAVAVCQASPQRSHQRGDGGRHAEADA
jgi:hypothetical protein